MKYILICLLVLYACSQKAGIVKSPALCNELKKDISKNWKLSSDSAFYETNIQFLHRLDSTYKTCLATENNVIFLLGEPNKKGNSFHRLELIYHIDKPCTPEHKYSCTDFIIYFDKSDTVIGTMILSTDTPHIQEIK
ncbi:MAG TPA: hypothetical protein PLU53_16020 [Bacteroidia bacterium]|nr:hypothetical protein [Bacteroidia bacterium]